MTQVSSPIPNGTPYNTWTCPKCKKKIKSNFCPWCGLRKPPERICSKCGVSYAGFSFCPNCGERLSNLIEKNEISDSWDQIIAAIYDGTVRERYAVGEYKPLDFGIFGVVDMQLAGFYLDERADGKGKAATTWIAMEQLSETHRMNPGYRMIPGYEKGEVGTGMLGGWGKSKLRQWLNDKVLPAMPDNIRRKMIEVKKRQDSYDASGTRIGQDTMDKLWIPSRDEIFGDKATYYNLFLDTNEKQIRKRKGVAAWWWLRSAYANSNANTVNGSGSYNYYTVYDSSGGVVVGFCL